MDDVQSIIGQIIHDIQQQQDYPPTQPKSGMSIINDLGFKSLDIAQLIAGLELELDVDPFSGTQGASLADISTVEDLCRVYQQAVIASKVDT